MVAPEDDFPVRPEPRTGRLFSLISGPAQPASELLEDRRSALALRMAAAFLFGIAFLWPEIADRTVVRLFAAYVFVDGILALAPGGWGLSYRLGWPLLIGGCVDLAASATAYFWTGMTIADLADVAAGWAVATALAFVLTFAAVRRSDDDQLFLLSGIASLLFGRALLSHVHFDAIILSTWMGMYAITMAILFLKLTLKHYRVMLLLP